MAPSHRIGAVLTNRWESPEMFADGVCFEVRVQDDADMEESGKGLSTGRLSERIDNIGTRINERYDVESRHYY
eukprot:IDg1216t1